MLLINLFNFYITQDHIVFCHLDPQWIYCNFKICVEYSCKEIINNVLIALSDDLALIGQGVLY